jgi:hypothetical protein
VTFLAAQGLSFAPHLPPAAQGLQPLVAHGFFDAHGFFVAHGFLAAQGLHPALQPAPHCCPALHWFLHSAQGPQVAAAKPPAPSMAVTNTADHQAVRWCSQELRIAFLNGCIVDMVSLPVHRVFEAGLNGP